MLRADTPLRFLKGVGPRRGEQLAALGVATLEDLLYVLPFRYEDRRSFHRLAELVPGGSPATLAVQIVSARLVRTRRPGFTIFEAQVSDASGGCRVVWYNQPYLARVFVAGRHAVLFGAATIGRRGLALENPDYEILDEEDGEGVHTGRIVPAYRKLGDLGSRRVRRLTFDALAEIDPSSLGETVPADVACRHGLYDRLRALREVHFPSDEAGRSEAQRALAFEEVYLLQLALALRREGLRHEVRGIAYDVPDALRTKLAAMLPFKLTEAQKRVVREIGADLRAPHPMNRLLQGDVGSGKTIVAVLALLVAVENGWQGALLAPTEILAEQHYASLRRILDGGSIDCRVALVHGSLRAPERRRAKADLATGFAKLAVGTHALFEPGVDFQRLGLVVIDEQHRFGVLQRAALVAKGTRPDVLVMTATPIPRSLALTLYGDLDLSVIDELPPGRTPVRTVVRTEEDRTRVYERLRLELERGRQAYVVVPLVEETEKSDLKAAIAHAAELARELPGLRIGLVHGRMKAAERDETMGAFRAGRVHALVATTVIEVGVDVPNASVMIIEHAERFGLSQLHQLRGRVGRGTTASHCVLMVADEGGRAARERLSILEQTTDGFRIAERDLDLRGPGAVFGTQQHGLSDLRFLAAVLRDPELLETAREEARRAVADPAGRQEAELRLAALGGRWRRRLDLAQVG
jgi:ATP-dependent DNA helicase RecG